ncbi:ComC/BlpC family peptide pheromone/bacteriocin [Streptococcus vestibularis]|uniref:ComC/BlpC family peptide pheromone/bacteriocin n=1 Tax=Streptococcus vestibularis TaxID=1343 RepID=UPI0029152490|nr:ComC/BlpC family peptide pheromone/bacteriocin [Streptococcus vestibularis]MDU5663653.1 ComC/BlpC family peptide pheromone/bacteriocin [Streptococcus vestibularis]
MYKRQELTYNDLETLASVEGGRVNWERWGMCGASVAVGASEGFSAAAGGTAFFIGPYTIGTGAVGAAIGGGVALPGC